MNYKIIVRYTYDCRKQIESKNQNELEYLALTEAGWIIEDIPYQRDAIDDFINSLQCSAFEHTQVDDSIGD